MDDRGPGWRRDPVLAETMSFRPTPRNRGACHYHLAAGCLLAALSCAVPLFASPTITLFQVPGAIGTFPSNINLSGTITGWYWDGTNHLGFVRDPSGQIATFAPPGNTGTYTQDINIAGTVVGLCFSCANSTVGGFMRDSKGTITEFAPPGYENGDSQAFGINAEGAIVGWAMGPRPLMSYVRLPDGTFHTFQVNNEPTYVSAINAAYLVTGYYTDANRNNHGFVTRPNSQLLATFDPPGSVATYPTRINAFGAIMGYYLDAAGFRHGFVRDPLGKIASFDPAWSKATCPTGMNDAGVIVGQYEDSNGLHSFVRDPLGKITPFDSGAATDINDAGVITGGVSTDGTTFVGFVRTP